MTDPVATAVKADVNSDVSWLKTRISQLEAEAESIWNRYETYIVIVGSLVVGAVIGHFIK